MYDVLFIATMHIICRGRQWNPYKVLMTSLRVRL